MKKRGKKKDNLEQETLNHHLFGDFQDLVHYSVNEIDLQGGEFKDWYPWWRTFLQGYELGKVDALNKAIVNLRKVFESNARP